MAPSPIRLCFQHFDCWPLLVLIFPVTHLPLAFFPPASSLIISFLYPSPPCGGFGPPMHFPSSLSPSHPPPFPLPQFQQHANIGTAVKFICTSAADSAEPFRWGRDIDLGWSSATMATWGKGMLSYHLHLRSTVRRQGCLRGDRGYSLRFSQ